MKQFILSLTQAIANLRVRANELLKGLPPLEQFDATSEVAYGLRSLQSGVNYITETADMFESKLTAIQEKVTAEVQEQLTQKLSAGEYLSLADSQAAANQAATNRETEVRTQFKTLATRRAELCAVPEGGQAILSEVLSRHLSDESLLAEDYIDRAKKIATRSSELQSLGLALPALEAELCALPLDAAGDALFTGRLATIQEVAGKSGHSKAPGAPAPLAVPPGGVTSAKKPTMSF